MSGPQKQQGVALIVVLFITALAATLAVQMNAKLMVEVQRSDTLFTLQQAKWYAMSGEALAKRALLESKRKDKEVINLKQPWAQSGATYPVDNGTISGEIRDLHSCLNLNALRAKAKSGELASSVNPAHSTLLELLKKVEDLPLTESEEALADSLADWLDADSIAKGQGVEEGEYLSYTIPYMTANNYLASVSELRLVYGFNPFVVEKLKPYVCVIPQSDVFKINVNTLEEEGAVLLAAMLNVETSNAETMISQRPDGGWKNINDFVNEARNNGAKTIKPDDDRFTVNSDYFELTTKAEFSASRFAMRSTLYIKDNKEVIVLARRFGGVQ